MDIKRQERAPIYEALEEFKKKRVVPVSYTHLDVYKRQFHHIVGLAHSECYLLQNSGVSYGKYFEAARKI